MYPETLRIFFICITLCIATTSTGQKLSSKTISLSSNSIFKSTFSKGGYNNGTEIDLVLNGEGFFYVSNFLAIGSEANSQFIQTTVNNSSVKVQNSTVSPAIRYYHSVNDSIGLMATAYYDLGVLKETQESLRVQSTFISGPRVKISMAFFPIDFFSIDPFVSYQSVTQEDIKLGAAKETGYSVGVSFSVVFKSIY